jgi:hypothetical protein
MFKRIMLALTFVAVFSTAGIGFAHKAEAWRSWGGPWGRPYAGYYAPRTVYYGPAVPYRAYYGPRYVRPYYSSYYGGYPVYSDYYYPGYYYGPRSGVSVSFGF